MPAAVGGGASHGRRRTTETSLRMRRRRASVTTRDGRRSSRMLRETRHSRERGDCEQAGLGERSFTRAHASGLSHSNWRSAFPPPSGAPFIAS